MAAQVGFSASGLGDSGPRPARAHQRQASIPNILHIQHLDNGPPSSGLHNHRQSHNSSKLPAFRFADLPKSGSSASSSTALSQPSLANQNHNAHAPLSPPAVPVSVSPLPKPVPAGNSQSADQGPFSLPEADPPVTSENLQSTTQRAEKQVVSASATAPTAVLTSSLTSPTSTTPTTPKTASASNSPHRQRSRASTLQPSSSPPTSVQLPTLTKRSASFPDSHPALAPSPSSTATVDVKPRSRRSSLSRRSNVAAGSTSPSHVLNPEHLQAVEAAQSSADTSTKGSPIGQRELILPKALSNSSPTDERRTSLSQRPPVSYRPPLNTNTQPTASTRVPPIRSFRSSGSRKSLVLDMNSRGRFYDFGDDVNDPNHDHTLRALEGRTDQDFLHRSPTSSARQNTLDNEDTGDVFLKIAREESSRRVTDNALPDETQNATSRFRRVSHRRPLSSSVHPYTPTSPPRVVRRLSDQQEASRPRKYEDERASEVSRVSTYRTRSRENAPTINSGEDTIRARPAPSRPSPLTPRSTMFQEPEPQSFTHTRRRSSITESNSGAQPRTATYKSSVAGNGQIKGYNSSPLVRSFDFHRHQGGETNHGRDGTESTASTTAPSTVWDELDDLKSRIHRLELTGKMPATSGAAISRLSDERPPTATTTVTTMSSSPKRPGGGAQPTEAASTVSAQREAHPILHAALAKSKLLLDSEVYRALESAANDAMSLSSMMGTIGHPGPISSGASTIGSGTTVTDRQLRRKADSVCRSLTELCLALGEGTGQARPTQTAQPHILPTTEVPATPTVNKTYSGLVSQRRPSAAAETNLARANTSPRAISKFEERRISLMSGTALPSPCGINSTPATPLESQMNRRSSLMVSRSRRAGTEEPEDGRQSSLLLRTRRAGTEEPEEGRRTSLLRSRRGTVGEEDDEQRFRAPSRAQTDLSNAPDLMRDQPTQASNMNSSAIPRRRFVSSNLSSSRLTTPMSSNTTPPRRYFERAAPRDSNTMSDKLIEERGQRHMSLGQTSLLGRTGSLNRRNRESTLPTASVSGNYR